MLPSPSDRRCDFLYKEWISITHDVGIRLNSRIGNKMWHFWKTSLRCIFACAIWSVNVLLTWNCQQRCKKEICPFLSPRREGGGRKILFVFVDIRYILIKKLRSGRLYYKQIKLCINTNKTWKWKKKLHCRMIRSSFIPDLFPIRF